MMVTTMLIDKSDLSTNITANRPLAPWTLCRKGDISMAGETEWELIWRPVRRNEERFFEDNKLSRLNRSRRYDVIPVNWTLIDQARTGEGEVGGSRRQVHLFGGGNTGQVPVASHIYTRRAWSGRRWGWLAQGTLADGMRWFRGGE